MNFKKMLFGQHDSKVYDVYTLVNSFHYNQELKHIWVCAVNLNINLI